MKRIFFKICVAAFVLLVFLVISLVVWRVIWRMTWTRIAGDPGCRFADEWQGVKRVLSAVPDKRKCCSGDDPGLALMRNIPTADRMKSIKIQSFPARWQHPTNEQIPVADGYVEMKLQCACKMAEALKLPKSRYPVDFSPGFERCCLTWIKLKNWPFSLNTARCSPLIPGSQPTQTLRLKIFLEWHEH